MGNSFLSTCTLICQKVYGLVLLKVRLDGCFVQIIRGDKNKEKVGIFIFFFITFPQMYIHVHFKIIYIPLVITLNFLEATLDIFIILFFIRVVLHLVSCRFRSVRMFWLSNTPSTIHHWYFC